MSASLQRRVERLSQLLETLVADSAKGVLIVVEGQNDVNALRELGVKGEIISAKTSRKSFLDVLSEVEGRKTKTVILLMDFDRRGKEWTKRLTQNLEKMRVKPNISYWKELLGLVGREVKDVEGLPTYLETLKKRIGD